MRNFARKLLVVAVVGAASLALAPQPANAGVVGCTVGAPFVPPVDTVNCVLDIGYCVGLYDPFLPGHDPSQETVEFAFCTAL